MPNPATIGAEIDILIVLPIRFKSVDVFLSFLESLAAPFSKLPDLNSANMVILVLDITY